MFFGTGHYLITGGWRMLEKIIKNIMPSPKFNKKYDIHVIYPHIICNTPYKSGKFE